MEEVDGLLVAIDEKSRKAAAKLVVSQIARVPPGDDFCSQWLRKDDKTDVCMCTKHILLREWIEIYQGL